MSSPTCDDAANDFILQCGLWGLIEEAEFEARLAKAFRHREWKHAEELLKNAMAPTDADFATLRRTVVDATMSALTTIIQQREKVDSIHRFLQQDMERIRTLLSSLPANQQRAEWFSACLPPIHLVYQWCDTDWDVVLELVRIFPLCGFRRSPMASRRIHSPVKEFFRRNRRQSKHQSSCLLLLQHFLENQTMDSLKNSNFSDDNTFFLDSSHSILEDALRQSVSGETVTHVVKLLKQYEIQKEDYSPHQEALRMWKLIDERIPRRAANGTSEDWKRVAAIVQAYPECASFRRLPYRSKQEQTREQVIHCEGLPLLIHDAVYGVASVEAVRTLLDAYPEGVFQTTSMEALIGHEANMFKEKEDPLPLNLAVLWHHKRQRDPDVVSELLQRYPFAARKQAKHTHHLPFDLCLPSSSAHKMRRNDCLVVRHVIAAYPEALRRRVGKKASLPLHRLAAMTMLTPNDDDEFIREVLQSWPHAARVKDLDGMYPLQLVCATCDADTASLPRRASNPSHPRWSKTTFQMLLQAYPNAARAVDKDGYLPLHHACVTEGEHYFYQLLEVYPDGAKETNRKGELPLHVLCRQCHRHGMPQLLRSLIEAYPEGLSVRESLTGCLPLHLILREWRAPLSFQSVGRRSSEMFRLALRAYPDAIFAPVGIVEGVRQGGRFVKKGFKQRSVLEMAFGCEIPDIIRIETLLEHAYTPNDLPPRDGSSHAEADGHDDAPMSAPVFPISGKLRPMHCACALSASTSLSWSLALETALRHLHHMFPNDIREPCDMKGRLPLHWIFCARATPSVEVIAALTDMNGGALWVTDDDGLTPFELACLHGAGVSQLYHLLREGPDVLQPLSNKQATNDWKEPGTEQASGLCASKLTFTYCGNDGWDLLGWGDAQDDDTDAANNGRRWAERMTIIGGMPGVDP